MAVKPSSHDICFVGPGGYYDLAAAHEPAANRLGPMLDGEGRQPVVHRRLAAYTVGQRRGLGIAAQGPLYVTALDAQRNAVHVSPRSMTLSLSLRVAELRWLARDRPTGALRVLAQTRYRSAAVPALVRLHGSTAEVRFDAPQRRVAPGQAVVFYRGDWVLGGGVALAPEPWGA